MQQSERRINWDPVEHYKEIAVAERYDAERFASLAGKVFNKLERASLARAVRGMPISTHFVDIPCGTGRLAEVLLERGYRVTGVDISPAMLHVAKRKLERFGDQFDVMVHDARTLKAAGRAFDAALCARVLMHFPFDEQVEFLKGVSEATSGPVVVTQSLETRYHVMRRLVKKAFGHQPPAAYPVTPKQLKKLLAACGLREERRARAMPLLSEAIIVKAIPN